VSPDLSEGWILGRKVYALGYSRHRDLEGFVGLLKGLKVGVLVDVRRFPQSRNPQFTIENLKMELPKRSIRYEFLGGSLGGYRRGGYEKYMETAEYKDGIKKLLEMCEEKSVAIMCLEPKSKYCHRRFIIQTLFKTGVEVILVE